MRKHILWFILAIGIALSGCVYGKFELPPIDTDTGGSQDAGNTSDDKNDGKDDKDGDDQ